MPTSGTHITVVEQLALHDPTFEKLLGNPDPLIDPDDPEAVKMRFSKLGAVGPDVFYMLGDFNNTPASALQDLENFLVKIGGTTSCISELSEKINKWLTGELDKITGGIASELQLTGNLLSGILTNGFIALLIDNGVNIWAPFRSPRQEDYDRKHWFWADYLHYVYTGDFVTHLLKEAKKSNDENLHAYALGYLTHYVTDVVGHPYVNQVVQAPFRLHWQRHHLVENFIDGYVWDRWHKPMPDPGGSAESPLDQPMMTPNSMGDGAPALSSRLHDHINIGESSLGDPVDKIIESVCQKIEKGLFDIGILEDTSMSPPNNQEFEKWCKFMAEAIESFYKTKVHPVILDSPPDPRPGGFPRADDVAGAYGVLRLLLKIQTEGAVEPPVFPDIIGDITEQIEKTIQDISNDIGGIPPFPTPNTSGSFSWDSLLDALADIVQWFGEVLEGIGKALVDLIAGLAGLAEVLVTDTIKIILWLLNSALYAMYQYFRDILVINAYGIPFTNELITNIGGLNTAEFWITKGNPASNNTISHVSGGYPAEEDPRERLVFGNTYRPYIPPLQAKKIELPSIPYVGPYIWGDRPESFLEAPLGPDNMFSGAAPQTQVSASGEETFTSTQKNFGGAINNSAKAINLVEGIVNADYKLPNFDMDGDRGYAWPDWEVDGTLLDPTKVNPVHVKAKPITT